MDQMSLFLLIFIVWVGLFGFIGNLIRSIYFNEEWDISNNLLGPITIIISGIEAIIIKCQEYKLENIREEARKPLTKYEKRAIERINKLLEINN